MFEKLAYDIELRANEKLTAIATNPELLKEASLKSGLFTAILAYALGMGLMGASDVNPGSPVNKVQLPKDSVISENMLRTSEGLGRVTNNIGTRVRKVFPSLDVFKGARETIEAAGKAPVATATKALRAIK